MICISIDDLNGDGVGELVVVTELLQLRSEERLKVFLLKEKKLIVIKGFENYPHPGYDSKTNKIFFYSATGCNDRSMFFGQGIIEGDLLRILEKINCDCCLENQDSCQIFINAKDPITVHYHDVHKYVWPFYQDFLRDKLKEVKED